MEGLQESRKGASEVLALHNGVDEAMLEEIFRPLEILGKFLACSLFHDPGSGEAHQGLGFGEDHIPQGGEGGGDAAGGGMGKDDDEGKLFTERLI